MKRKLNMYTKSLGDRGTIKLKGEYYIGDPCYVFPNHSDWDDVCDEMFGEEEYDFNDREQLRLFEINGIKSFWFGTAYGDGEYPLYVNNSMVDTLGVDAGMLSLIPIEIIKLTHPELLTNDDEFERLGFKMSIDGEYTFELDNGNLRIGPIFLETRSEFEDDEYEEEDYDEDEDL